MWKLKISDGSGGFISPIEMNALGVPLNLGTVDDATVQQLKAQSESIKSPVYEFTQVTDEKIDSKTEFRGRKRVIINNIFIELGNINFSNQTTSDYKCTYTYPLTFKGVPNVCVSTFTVYSGFFGTANRVFGSYANPTLKNCQFGTRRTATSGSNYTDTALYYRIMGILP